MERLVRIEDLQKLESTLAVESILCNGIRIWPLLRIYFGARIAYAKDTRVQAGQSINLDKIKSIFYGLGDYFKGWKYLGLSSSDQRKDINGKWVDKMDYLANSLDCFQILELPNPRNPAKRSLSRASVASKIPMYLFIWFTERFLNPRIEGLDLIKEIENSLGVEIDERAIVRRFMAQNLVANALINFKKVKVLFLTTPYSNLGYVYAFKKKGRMVVEFQHGIISNGHFAYQVPRRIDDDFYPDYLLSTGEIERSILKNSAYIDISKIRPVGSFYIDYIISKEIDESGFKKLKMRYDIMVCVSAQDRLEDLYIPFLREIAQQNRHIGFLLCARFRDSSYYDKFNFGMNVFLFPEYNTYESIRLCDFHTTINSTTAIEALALGTRNILMNVKGLSRSFFGEILSNPELTVFADTPLQFSEAVVKFAPLNKADVRAGQKDLIKGGYEDNIREVLSEIITG